MRTKLFGPLKITYPVKNNLKNKTAPEKLLHEHQQNIKTSTDNNLQMQAKNLKKKNRCKLKEKSICQTQIRMKHCQ